MHTFRADNVTCTIFNCADFGHHDHTTPVDPHEIMDTVLATGYACLTPDILAELLRNHRRELKPREGRPLLIVPFASDLSAGQIIDMHDGWRIDSFDEVHDAAAMMRDPRFSWLFMATR